MNHSVVFKRSLRFITLPLVLSCTLTLLAGKTADSSSVITASGQRLDSIFDGLTPSQQVRDTIVFKSKTRGIQSPPILGSLNIGRMLGIGSSVNASSCPTGGICANPGTTGGPGQRCQDSSGCDLQAHNQASSENPCDGVLEQYLCDECCVDWEPCTLPSSECQEFGGGGSPCTCLNCDGTTPSGNGDDVSPTCSPIILDVDGENFHLTSAAGGVMFDIAGSGHAVQIAWTDPHFHNAFLALPGPDGLVHSGKELFGNFTPQPQSPHPNGFIALAPYDEPENGGNGDGIIDEHDHVYSQLRLWIDENHDGVCQANELHRLPEFGVYSLALNYVESKRTDQFGNRFRYKAKVNPGSRRDERDRKPTDDPGRWTYDVFFIEK